MKILLVYPQFPDTFWSFKHALKFISKKTTHPPLGLLTVAAMLPQGWEKKLVDVNVSPLGDADIKWADYVFIGAMAVQRESAKKIIARCRELGTRIVAGGPLFTTEFQQFGEVDHLVVGEAEETLPALVDDLEKQCAHHIYAATGWPDITRTPVPLWSLVDRRHYSSMNMQYSRGCPFDCEFCDIVRLNGHRPRTKTREQVLAELEGLYQSGWRGHVFVVDDNFIGNKRKLKEEILPAIIEWNRSRKYPLTLATEATVNLADDEELMRLMLQAGFDTIFVGIETPDEGSLAECGKSQNRNRDLVSSVKKIQRAGMEVQGGFIVGFDSDPPSIFKSQIDFIQRSGIVTAMVSILTAVPGTRLHERLAKENRLVGSFTGNNYECSLNYVPKMKPQTLIDGYRDIMYTIYSPEHFYDRLRTFLKEYRPPRNQSHVQFGYVKPVLRSLWLLGVKEKGRRDYWSLLASTLFTSPRKFPRFMLLAIYGYHFRTTLAGQMAR